MLGTRSVSGGSFYDNPSRDVFNDGIYGDEYGDGDAVVGGFVYRGSAIPALEGMYVLGAYEYVVPVSPRFLRCHVRRRAACSISTRTRRRRQDRARIQLRGGFRRSRPMAAEDC